VTYRGITFRFVHVQVQTPKQNSDDDWLLVRSLPSYHRSFLTAGIYRVYQNGWSGLEVDYIYKYGEETYKYKYKLKSNSRSLCYMPTNASFLRTAKKRLSHSCHTFFRHTRPSCTFSFTEAPRCLKLLIPASNAIGRWAITVELSQECSLNRNNWFVLHKLQHTERLLLRSRHYRFVTSQTEREEGSGIAHAHKTWTPAVSFHVGNLVLRAFWKP